MKKLCAMLLVACLVCTTLSMGASANQAQIVGDGNTVIFVDLAGYDWAKDAIEYFASRGIVQGDGNGNFEPENPVTREEFCKMLALTFQAPIELPSEPTFEDVAADRWSYPYIEVCKTFLTGYINPFGGKASFHPAEAATREDIAVALVRILGLSDDDVRDSNYLKDTFRDAQDVSPALADYVNIAAERGLIKGYDDGTLRPQQGITRAETVVLLNRVTKQAYTEIDSELEVSANVDVGADPRDITIRILAEEGTQITVDGQEVEMKGNGSGNYEGKYEYTFAEEGEKTFYIEAFKMGKTKTLSVSAQYEAEAPTITVTYCLGKTDSSTTVIRGRVKDASGEIPAVQVNGRPAEVDSNGDWWIDVSLQAGTNQFTITATNSAGKTAYVERSIICTVTTLVMYVTQCPEISYSNHVTISGKVNDMADDSPTVTVNGIEAIVAGDGTWSSNVTLNEGANKVEIVARNKFGREVKAVRYIEYQPKEFDLIVIDYPKETSDDTATITCRVTDYSDGLIDIKVNGVYSLEMANQDFRKTVRLEEGSNRITVIAGNELEVDEEVFYIVYTPRKPIITSIQCPTTTDEKTITVSVVVADTIEEVTSVTINGQPATQIGSREWTAQVQLSEDNDGENRLIITATNCIGESISEERLVHYRVTPAPELAVEGLQEVSDVAEIVLRGTTNGTGVTVNGMPATVNADGSWEAAVVLQEGANEITIIATNDSGQSIEKTVSITYTPPVEPESEAE